MVKFGLNKTTTSDPVTKWTARWIWLSPDDKGPDSIIYARKEISLPDNVTEALIHITADSKYEFFINGKRIGRGPARCDFRFQLYDTYDIASFLHAGRNVLAVLVVHYGYGTGWAMGKKAGLLVQSTVTTSEGKEFCLDTPDGWKLKKSECWPKKMIRRWQKHPPRGEALGAVEVFDSRLEPKGWMNPGFDDSQWLSPVVLRDNGGEIPPIAPWTHLEPRPIPFMKEQSVLPQKIVRIGDTEAKILEYDVAIQMSCDITISPPRAVKFENVEALLRNDDSTTIIIHPSLTVKRAQPQLRDGVILVDFGREVCGYPRIKIKGPAGTVVDLGYSERLIDDHFCAYINSCRYADRLILSGDWQTYETFDWKGFRYLQVTFRNAMGPIEIERIDVIETGYPVEEKGSFECSDDFLNELWKVCRHTLHCCMHDAFIDCPWREQRQFGGDSYTQMLFNFAAFGDPYLPARMVRLMTQGQDSSGLIPQHYPEALDELLTNLVDYTLWPLAAVGDILLYTGDASVYQDVRPHIELGLNFFRRRINKRGLIEDVSRKPFIDWAPLDKRGECIPLNLIYALTLRKIAYCAREMDERTQAQQLEHEAQCIVDAVRNFAWIPERGLFVDALIDGNPGSIFSQHTNALAVLLDVANAEQKRSIRERLFDNDLIQVEPFFSFFLLEALGRLDEHPRALDFIRTRWGTMIEAGSSTTWEEWQVHGTWRKGTWIPQPRSLCHAWSAGPLFFMSSEILGIRPSEQQFRKILIAPKTGNLTYARGTFPTPHGKVHVAWEIDTGRFHISITIPEGCVAEIHLPGKGEIYMNGSSYPNDFPLEIGPGEHNISMRITV